MNRHLLSIIVVALVLPAFVHADNPKLPIPSDAAQQEALTLVKEVHGDEYAHARTAAQKSAFAKKLISVAAESGDTTNRYACLRVAKDAAVQAGDGVTAFKAVANAFPRSHP